MGFIDTVSAEDIGKFADVNGAESLSRVAGAQISRDITGEVVNQAVLLAHDPGLTITQIDNTLLPRPGRHVDEQGDRNRVSGVFNAEYRPSQDLKFYVDTLVANTKNDLRRIDTKRAVRNGASILLNMTVDGTCENDCENGCAVQKGSFANTQNFLEVRPVIETTKLRNINPGTAWQLGDRLRLDAQAMPRAALACAKRRPCWCPHHLAVRRVGALWRDLPARSTSRAA